MDIFTKEKRSYIMSRIKSKDSKIEVMVRSYLHRLGFRFRKNDPRFPGKPDLALPKLKTAIFIHGCFWHAHRNCKLFQMPKTNRKFWRDKLGKNILNDRKKQTALKKLYWKSIVLWECRLENNFEREMLKLCTLLEKNR